MKRTLFEKVKYIFERFIFHGKKFVKDTGEVFKNRIDTAEEAIELLKTRATVKDLFELEGAVKGAYFSNGKVNSYMPSTEYILYDEHDFRLYLFNGEKNDTITDEELLKVSKIINSIKNAPKTVFSIKVLGKYQYYFLISEGDNGFGDFVDGDMKNIISYLDAMKEAGTTWRSITDLNNDMVDDISNWVITFTVS